MSFGGGDSAGAAMAASQRQMALATREATKVAMRAQEFSEQFFKTYVAPYLETMTETTAANEARTSAVFDLQFDQAKLQDQRYRSLGVPAEDRFYKMVEEYSAPEYQEQQAALALGDVKTAQTNQRDQLSRTLRSRGIDPSSPAAISALTDMAVMGSIAEAGAVNKARIAARDLGMRLTADGANFGRGGLAGGLSYSQAATGSAGANQAVVQGALDTASGAARVPLQGYQTAGSIYGNNLSAWSSFGGQALRAQATMDAANAEGIGTMLGTVGGAAIKYGLPMISDRRLKRNIVKIGELAPGIGLYEFDFAWGGERQRGVMADEVAKIYPDVVGERGGFQTVDYAELMRRIG